MITRAIDSYSNIAKLEDTLDQLNLAWTQDERNFIDPPLTSLITECLTRELCSLKDIYHYAVDDPWGENLLSPHIKRYFSLPDNNFSLSCGAGVTSLLASLANLREASSVAVYGDIYPDFIWWLTQAKSNISWLPSGPLDEMCHAASCNNASIVFLERPALLAGQFDDLALLKKLCGLLEKRGIILLIDESNANYHAPGFSSTSLLNTFSNLIVLRGVSKAWGLGGIRVAFCLSSSALRERIRQVVPPLLNPPITLSLAAALLSKGDTTQLLRQQIILHKTKVINLLPINAVIHSNSALPYIFINEALKARCDIVGIRTKYHSCHQSLEEKKTLIRMSVPLKEERMTEFMRRLECGL
ncbi:aminotransferase class I/II-fold pyridoxal phosphate-dependent enzyme [Pectobacterium polaris]|uniref:aminotransferase class I/II-fold pyridoxal phosphate-dependent enzyme n=1 Tax=Pectobacterium polaris TaxID=2042057 RepID=UPI0023AE9786|nr:aminotransferase class I/II-fold pyridoxal phosphate-dependent enzyme [Pectobacterium polaris]MDE8755255.1 aminotransferase class I/II-fold pyridoxal phosphate-dependent enzyme [Pectobacterium polaris]